MMVFTTMFVSVIILGLLYYFLIRYLPWAVLGYIVVAGVAVLCFMSGTVHFSYIGIEILGFGSAVVWWHFRKIR